MNKFNLILSVLIMTFVPSITFGNVIEKLNVAGKFNKLNETLAKSGLNENLKGLDLSLCLRH